MMKFDTEIGNRQDIHDELSAQLGILTNEKNQLMVIKIESSFQSSIVKGSRRIL